MTSTGMSRGVRAVLAVAVVHMVAVGIVETCTRTEMAAHGSDMTSKVGMTEAGAVRISASVAQIVVIVVLAVLTYILHRSRTVYL